MRFDNRRRTLIKTAASAWLIGQTAAASSREAEKPQAATKSSCPKPTREKTQMIRLQTSLGAITLELDEAKAPATVANFLAYVKSGHYNNTIFHRVIDGFMIQGGGFEPGMKEKPTNAPVKNEAANGLTNDLYTIAMARTPDPHSASSQFFINVANNSFLNFKAATAQGFGYCVFGKVSEGKEVVDKIKGVATGDKGGHQDVPVQDVVIQSAEVC
jgi:peptidyl-prolyl cis-trans isomerase B (cyclophilin B)